MFAYLLYLHTLDSFEAMGELYFSIPEQKNERRRIRIPEHKIRDPILDPRIPTGEANQVILLLSTSPATTLRYR